MKKLLILLYTVPFLMTACTKEPSFENPDGTPGGNTGGGTTETKLVRIGIRSETDSLTIDYGYNSGGRLSLVSYSGSYDGNFVDFHFAIKRNAANVITSVTAKSPLLVPAGYDADSLTINFSYDAVANQYLRGVAHYGLDNENFADSAVYSYNGGKLASQIFYFDDGSGYLIDAKEDCSYSGTNLTSLISSFYNGSSFDLAQTETYEYDANVNPLQSTPDAPVFGTLVYAFDIPFLDMLFYFSANNLTKQTTVLTNPTQTGTAGVAYEYNSDKTPAKAVISDGNDSYTVTYHYQ